jgi:DNA-directed RNA polymerase subunit beta
MYAYIDRKKKLPVTTLFRAIGFERDKDILEIFDLLKKLKFLKQVLKNILEEHCCTCIEHMARGFRR